MESDRSARHAGALLYMSQNLMYPDAMLALRTGDRVTGLRLQGYSFGRGGDESYTIGDKYGTTNGLNVSAPYVLIDNNDIAGWPGTACRSPRCALRELASAWRRTQRAAPAENSREDTYLTSLAQQVHITNNFIHNNVGCTDGYGVTIGGDSAFALIDRNVFDYNKHDVAGDGTAGSGYIASSNLDSHGRRRMPGRQRQGQPHIRRSFRHARNFGRFGQWARRRDGGNVHRDPQQRDPRRPAFPHSSGACVRSPDSVRHPRHPHR